MACPPCLVCLEHCGNSSSAPHWHHAPLSGVSGTLWQQFHPVRCVWNTVGTVPQPHTGTMAHCLVCLEHCGNSSTMSGVSGTLWEQFLSRSTSPGLFMLCQSL
ncbi:hypothetical protein ACOMHN_037193 [Nucella lapillus]